MQLPEFLWKLFFCLNGCDRCAEVLCKLNLARIGAQRVALKLFDLLSRMYAAFVPEVAQEFISVLMPMQVLVPAIVMALKHASWDKLK